MKKLYLNLMLVGLIAFAMSSCNNWNVSTFLVNKDTNFGDYKTFAFVKFDEGRFPKGMSIVMLGIIKQDITQQMILKGYKPDTTGNPGIAINLGMTVENKQSATAYTAPYGGGYYYGPSYYWGPVGYSYGWAPPVTTVYVDNYQVGTLLVDVIDFKKNVLLWHGSVSGVMQPNNDNQTLKNNVGKAIGDMFKSFPSILPINQSN